MGDLVDVTVDCVILTVLHDVFKKIGVHELKEIMNGTPLLIDVPGAFAQEAEKNGFIYQTL